MESILFVAIVVFAYALVSHRLEKTIISGPMVFTAVGVAAGFAGGFGGEVDESVLGYLVEATLALLLFTDAARINVVELRRQSQFPIRLLGIGLPATFLFGLLVGSLLFSSLLVAEVALLAAALSPTDAALGQAVVSDARLPVRIRQSLNVESGLNDGIVVPVVAIALAFASAEESGQNFTGFVFKQIGYGVAIGLIGGVVGAYLVNKATEAGWIEDLFQQLSTFAIVAILFVGALLVDGNGFIAAFVGGMTFGVFAKEHCKSLHFFVEQEAELLSSITFMLFGAVMVPLMFEDFDWRSLVFAVFALTLMRMVPVFVCLLGTGTLTETKLFVGWFGPRGLASILFAVEIAHELSGSSTDLIVHTIVLTVLLSVFAHGMTANPWVGRIAKRLDETPHDAPEMAEVHEMPTRRGMAAMPKH